jgi:hypothetical protein
MRKLANDNIKVNVYKHTAMEWTGFKGLRIATNFEVLLNNVMNPRNPRAAGVFLTSRKTISFIKRKTV